MYPALNNTKWRELRLAMCELGNRGPKWRTKCITNGYVSEWDGEWFYHFAEGGYEDIEWLEIQIRDEEQKELVVSQLHKIHVPGHETEHGFKVYGYIKDGDVIEYL